MQPLLYLVHRIPFPPDKGDKIRSYHLLTHLCKYYRVYLGAFVDDDADWQHLHKLESMCKQVFLQPLPPLRSRIKSVSGFFSGKALTLPYYSNSAMQRWVDDVVIKNNISQAVVFSAAMAQFVNQHDKAGLRRVIDFVDVDSDKWRQYGEQKSWPMSWLYKREALRLFNFEVSIASIFNGSYFVSKEEASYFNQLSKGRLKGIDFYNNGVDTEFFSPNHNYTSPFVEGEKPIVFTGAMDYWANIDAVSWFAEEIFPRLYANDEKVRFYIVGARPSASVSALSRQKGVVVTGRVQDVRPYLAYAKYAVAPMRIARGIQNKVLEAMAMGCKVMVTSAGAEGISAKSGEEFMIADTVPEMLDFSEKFLYSDSYLGMGEKSRNYVMENFDWEDNLTRINTSLNLLD